LFPAAILQALPLHYQADEAVNYGGIGAVAMKISHGFMILEHVIMLMEI
jgi:predicted metalloendopeptidase